MLPTLFLPHGGGPYPVLGHPSQGALTSFLSTVAKRIPEKPKAILLVSAHWEEKELQLTSAPNPGLLYDYYNFPPEAYKITYPAPGSPGLAEKAAELLTIAGFKSQLNPKRYFDHGAFIPLKLVYPDADIPVVQLSLMESLNPEVHYRVGTALQPLRSQGVLIMGSGMSFHNMQGFAFRDVQEAPAGPVGQDFNQWLMSTCTKGPDERQKLLADWAKAPGARYAHPREEHLIPLMVAAGAAHGSGSSVANGSSNGLADGAKGHVLWDGVCMGAAVSAFGFGNVQDST